ESRVFPRYARGDPSAEDRTSRPAGATFVQEPLHASERAAGRCSLKQDLKLTARGESPPAFGRRCIPADCVAPRSNIPDILGRRALSAGRLAALGATPDFHHGLLGCRPDNQTE